MELANSSKFEGERANALDAARRIAARHGMTLEEAARTGLEQTRQQSPNVLAPDGRRDPRAAYFAYAHQQAVEREKRRWEEAVQKARERGLDGGIDQEPRQDLRPRRSSKSRRDPIKHASVLLEETRLPFNEIADITGLSVYAIVGMKLKMRSAV